MNDQLKVFVYRFGMYPPNSKGKGMGVVFAADKEEAKQIVLKKDELCEFKTTEIDISSPVDITKENILSFSIN